MFSPKRLILTNRLLTFAPCALAIAAVIGQSRWLATCLAQTPSLRIGVRNAHAMVYDSDRSFRGDMGMGRSTVETKCGRHHFRSIQQRDGLR